MSPPTGPKNPVSSDPYSLLENSVYQDKTQHIKGIRHYPVFVSAIIQLAEEAKAKGSPVLVAHHVGAAELVFTDQSNFKHISQQFGIYEALYGVQELIDHSLAQTIISKKLLTELPRKLKNVLRYFLLFFSQLYSHFSQTCCHDDACKACKLCQKHDSDVEMMTSYHPDGSCAQALLDKTDCILAKDGKVPHSTLRDYAQALDQTACQQLFALDIAQQLCKQLIARCKAVRTALDDHDIADTGILIRDLQVTSDLQLPAITENSSIEVSGTDPKVDKVANAIEATL
ncbi:hypothetical protein C0989_007693 [Termitomyces sp. Mn162]|nr:hypothetical protein C0989_007693 [Termitomyces sp. Mn162]